MAHSPAEAAAPNDAGEDAPSESESSMGRDCSLAEVHMIGATCQWQWQRCCKNVESGATQCIWPRAKTGQGEACFAGDAQWIEIAQCEQFTDCAAGQRCCREPALAGHGMTKNVCEPSCSDAGVEVCVQHGTCAAGQACTSDDGTCPAPGTRVPLTNGRPRWTSVAGPRQDGPVACPPYTMPTINDRLCHRICGGVPGVCGPEETCVNDYMHGPFFCFWNADARDHE